MESIRIADQIMLNYFNSCPSMGRYVNLMAVLLVEADSGEATSANSSTLNRLVKELCGFVKKMHLLNPVTTRQLTACKLEETADDLEEVEPAERWLTLSRSMGLSHQQRQEIIQLRRLFITRMENIVQQRKDIHEAQLRVTAVPKFSRITAAQSLESHDAIEQLRASLKEEHLLKMDWALTLFKHTLLPMQVARALVQAWPWAPDTLAVATWVAAEDNEAGALAMMSRSTHVHPPVAPLGTKGLGSRGYRPSEATCNLTSIPTSRAMLLGPLSSLPLSAAAQSSMLHSSPRSILEPISSTNPTSQLVPASTLTEMQKPLSTVKPV